VKSTDLNLLSFFTGKTEVNLGIGFEKTRSIFVLSRSSNLVIPDSVSLPFVNADAFRLCVEEGVFSGEEINQYLTSHETELENTSKRLFPSVKGSAVNDEDIFQDSLEWDGNISEMDSNTPVVIHQRMESTAPLSCHFSLFPPQFSFATQNFTFIGVPNEKVTYNMTFPKGVSINILSSSQQVIEKTVEDGESLLSVTLNASETGKVATVLLSMEPSLVYVIGLFVPCIISVVITLILFIVVYVIRKKRNVFRQNEHRQPSNNENEGYENEEYYIPPKPPSSR
jgi:large-conductance mechanosensitive channel